MRASTAHVHFLYFSELDGKVTYGDVKKKEEAKRTYDIARSRGHSAGLVTQRYVFSIVKRRVCNKSSWQCIVSIYLHEVDGYDGMVITMNNIEVAYLISTVIDVSPNSETRTTSRSR